MGSTLIHFSTLSILEKKKKLVKDLTGKFVQCHEPRGIEILEVWVFFLVDWARVR